MEQRTTYTAFAGQTMLATGPLEVVLPALQSLASDSLVLIFDDHSGRQVDFDMRGTIEQVLERAIPARGPGRPKLGVVSREVSLLPRHWEWLEEQPNGASAALRRLVDEARKREPGRQKERAAIDATARFLTAMAGNLPNYEEATRALYAGEGPRFEGLIADWPQDIRDHALRLAATSA
jgi:uncharacterized protein